MRTPCFCAVLNVVFGLQVLSNAEERQPMPADAPAEKHEPAPPATDLAANEMLCDGVLTRWSKVILMLAHQVLLLHCFRFRRGSPGYMIQETWNTPGLSLLIALC